MGLLKFHHYLYGRKFTCQTDHKPLADIHLKHLNDAPSRLQRLLLKLQPYDITKKYVSGQKVPAADALSRVIPSGKTAINGLDVTIHDLTTTFESCKSRSHAEGNQRGSGLADAYAIDDAVMAWTHQIIASSTQTILAVKRGSVHWLFMYYFSG